MVEYLEGKGYTTVVEQMFNVEDNEQEQLKPDATASKDGAVVHVVDITVRFEDSDSLETAYKEKCNKYQ